jgi:hypothetical protein
MSNVLNRNKDDDWIVTRKMYNIIDDHIDIGNRIISTIHHISNLSTLSKKSLKDGSIVDGYLTNNEFFITSVKS